MKLILVLKYFGKLAYYFRGLGELPRFRGLDFTIEADGEIIKEKSSLY